MPSRREFFRTGALAGTTLLLPQQLRALPRRSAPTRAGALRKFIDPLPKPRALAPIMYDNGVPVYLVTAAEFTQQLHSDMGPTTVWGYDGSYPGPTIEARRDEPLRVIWSNQLGTGAHLLPVDRTLHGTNMGEPDRRIVTHLHGGIVPPEADGFPEDWFVSGTAEVYTYPNAQRAATLWYHDHALAITRLNVQAGLAAFYLLRDDEEDALVAQGMPAGEFEIPIAIQDRSFHEDGSLFYPDTGITSDHPVWVPEFFGDTAVVNGVVYPVLEVEPRRYRLRLLNGCNARFLNLQLLQYVGGRYRGNGPAFVMIGSDGGLLPRPVSVSQDPAGRVPRRMLMGPGERMDVVVDFTDFAGQEIVLHNNASAPFTGFVQGNARPPHRPGHPIGADLTEIMLFRVRAGTASERGEIPATLSATFEPLDTSEAVLERQVTLDEVLNEAGLPLAALLQNRLWLDPTNEERALGTTEIWHLTNRTADSHPIHLHLDHFQVLWRRAFDVTRSVRGGRPQWRGPARTPLGEEAGWKDTVVAHPGEVTAIAVRSDSYTGVYPFHCHILEHEDNEMMLRFQVS